MVHLSAFYCTCHCQDNFWECQAKKGFVYVTLRLPNTKATVQIYNVHTEAYQHGCLVPTAYLSVWFFSPPLSCTAVHVGSGLTSSAEALRGREVRGVGRGGAQEAAAADAAEDQVVRGGRRHRRGGLQRVAGRQGRCARPDYPTNIAIANLVLQ